MLKDITLRPNIKLGNFLTYRTRFSTTNFGTSLRKKETSLQGTHLHRRKWRTGE